MKLTYLILLLNLLIASPFTSAQLLCPIVPRPAQITLGTSKFLLNKRTSIVADKSLSSSTDQLRKILVNTGFAFPSSHASKNCIIIKIDSNLKSLTSEGYRLTVTKNKIEVSASDTKGLYYGFVSLAQLLPVEIYGKSISKDVKWEVTEVRIEDQPRFLWRGFMLDVSRQFFSYETLKKYVDWLAIHKINIFHIHLSDDPGWRIEIKKYPELTMKGAWRGKGEVLKAAYGSGDARYGGFYTQEQLKELVKYAAERNIQILPEIDMPGHSKAVSASYPEVMCVLDSADQKKGSNVYCAAKESNFEMIDNIIEEVASIFPFEYLHIGGDEVNHSHWKNCVNCQKLMKDSGFTQVENIQNYFVKRLEKIVTNHGKKMIGWNEIMHGGELNKKTAVMAWEDTEPAYDAAAKGHPVVMSAQTYYYLDKPQALGERGWYGDPISTEKVYSFDPMEGNKLSASDKKNIFGVQGNLWSEMLDKPINYDQYQAFPRLCAIAETGWTPQANRNWVDFSDRMGAYHFSRLSMNDIHYRLFTPTIKIENNTVTLIPPYKNAIMRYTLDGSEPTEASMLYSAPFGAPNAKLVCAKTFMKNGNSSPVAKAQ